jgi:hypothetical protein
MTTLEQQRPLDEAKVKAFFGRVLDDWGGCEPIAVSKEHVIDRYHEQLCRRLSHDFDQRTWEAQLRLGLLGQAVRQMGELLWAVHRQTTDAVLRDRWVNDLTWWCGQARAGLKWL